MMTETGIYADGSYLAKHPGWHAEDAEWKAGEVLRMLDRHDLHSGLMCEIGCGSGQILAHLQNRLPDSCMFHGYEISPQAIELCQGLENPNLQFYFADYLTESTPYYDVLMLLDVVEHLEDPIAFLRSVRTRARFKLLHIPLELNVQAALRNLAPVNWDAHGHLHFHSRDTAIRLLQRAGLVIVDEFYTSLGSLPAKTMGNRVAKLPRRLGFKLHPHFTARVLGGFSLMLLAK